MFDKIGCMGKYLYRKYVKHYFSQYITQNGKSTTDLLRLKILKLPENKASDNINCDLAWINNNNRLRKKILELDPHFFWNGM